MGITVTELRQIHDFAIKWADKFRDPSLDPIAVGNHAMANDCARLGFKWEDAHAFSEKYGKVKHRQSDCIFCSVIFDRGYKHYYYLTDDEGIAVGDFVIVPAGRDNHEAVVEVVAVEYFSKENAPLPVEKTKKILRKYIYEGDD